VTTAAGEKHIVTAKAEWNYPVSSSFSKVYLFVNDSRSFKISVSS